VSFILNIDTAVQTSSVCLAKGSIPISIKINPSQKDSASWLHLSIEEIIKENDLEFSQLNAIAISAGPGSYTGLRVGMAAAKGLCYVLQKPLITINTLEMMAVAAQNNPAALLCPMIDARRMEVFTAVFNKGLNKIVPDINCILNENSFRDLLDMHKILFFGNGSTKFQQVTKHQNAQFKRIEITAESMTKLSFEKLIRQEFADLAYSEPFYGKDFHSTVKQSL